MEGLMPGNNVESSASRNESASDAIVSLKKKELKISRIHTLGVHLDCTCALVGNDDGAQ